MGRSFVTALEALIPEDQRRLVRKRRQPAWVDPMLATLTEDYFSDPEWIFEPKLDGVRCIAFKKGREVRLLSRNRLSLNERYPEIVRAVEKLKGDELVLDGEAAIASHGVTRFQSLQRHLLEGPSAGTLGYFVFDVPFATGLDLRKLPVLTRKKLLYELVGSRGVVTCVRHIEEEGEKLLEQACVKGWEGIIAKRASSTYTGARSKEWLKFKCSKDQELVIGGFTDPQGSRIGFGALLVGYFEGGDFRYAGKVGTGFDSRLLRALHERLAELEQPHSPFADKLPVRRKGVHWVRPELVAQIGFSEWTRDGRLRHPRFLGLREDKSARNVIRETR